MAYIRGFIQENTKFHIVMKIPLSSISNLNTQLSTSLNPTKEIYMVLCNDGDKLIWKSNPTDFLVDGDGGAGTFLYTAKSGNYYFKCLNGTVYSPLVINDSDILTYDSTKVSSIGLKLECDEAVRQNIIWGGIEYSPSYNVGSGMILGDDITMKFKKLTTPITPGGTQNTYDTIHGIFYNTNSTEVDVNITTLGGKLMFIPHIDHTHNSKGLIQFSDEYTHSLEFFKKYIQNIFASNYRPLVGGSFADEDMIVIFTQTKDQIIKYVYNYCTVNDIKIQSESNLGKACGRCMGICENDEICSVHYQTGEIGQPMLTCDHTPYEDNGKSMSIYMGIAIGAFILIILFFILTEKKLGRL